MLRQESSYFTGIFLSHTAAGDGFDSTTIPLRTAANGYAEAGVGFVKKESGKPVKVRFAYTSDEDLAALCRSFPRDDQLDFTEEGDGGWEFESLFPPDHFHESTRSPLE